MEDRLIKLDNLERILIDNIHLDITDIQNKIVDLKFYIFSLKPKEIKDKKVINMIDDEIKRIEESMKKLGVEFEEKLKNNKHYNDIIKDILLKLFYYRNDILSKCNSNKAIEVIFLIGIDEKIKYLINYIVALNQSIFDEKATAEETLNYIKKEVAEIDKEIEKLKLQEEKK